MVPARRTIRDGLVVGVVAYASVALFYSVFDFLAARGALFTVDLLGKAMFRGLRDPGILAYPIRPDPSAIIWYNGLHLVISVAIGLIVITLIELAERHPARARLVQFTIVGGFVITILMVGVLTSPMRPLLPWWSIVGANALAVLLAGWYLLRQRPGLWRRLAPFAGRPRFVGAERVNR
jgi:hypothetical protein